jgi:hypothetical protein
MIKLFETKARTTKNESDSLIWEVSNGFKVSRKAKKLLGISSNEKGNIAVGTINEELIIFASDETFNGSISKNNLITNSTLVDTLKNYGNRFKINSEENEHQGIKYFTLSVEEDLKEEEEEVENSNVILEGADNKDLQDLSEEESPFVEVVDEFEEDSEL